jgi:pyruvate/2-oxoglutarate dehydrogenase complex dihydrolipoamide dehydrogenase (E3) component
MTRPVITEIKVDNKKLKELESMLKSAESKIRKQRHLAGECLIYGEIPSKLVTYHMDGIKLVEKYCKKHFKGIKWDK